MLEEGRRKRRRKGENRCVSFQSSPLRKGSGRTVEKKGRGKNCEVQRGTAELLQCMLNLNPKTTGLLKHERLGSSSVFWHLRTTVTDFISCALPGCKCFLSRQPLSALMWPSYYALH